MANVKITDLTNYGTAGANDVIPVVDTTNNVTKKISIYNLLRNVPGATSTSDALIRIGANAGGPRYAYIDLVGDTVHATYGFRLIRGNGGENATSQIAHRGTGALIVITQEGAPLVFYTNSLERGRFTAGGQFLLGISSARANFFNSTFSAELQVEGANHNDSSISLVRNETSQGAYLVLGSTGGSTVGSNTLSPSNATFGVVSFQGADGAQLVEGAIVGAQADGTPAADAMPTRLVVYTNPGGTTPTECARFTSRGYLKATANGGVGSGGTYIGSTALYHELSSKASNTPVVVTRAATATFNAAVNQFDSTSTAASTWQFVTCLSNVGGTQDLEFNLRGDGNGLCDGAWTGGGADYAEYFEWSDGNPNAEDRRGIAVVLVAKKIRPATAGEDPIGVISGNPSIVGDAAWNKWSGKYLRDDYNSYILEDYETEDEDGNIVTAQRRKLNPDYDPDATYTSREERPEWACVGLMGKLRVRKGQPTGNRWIKMRTINKRVDEWLVR